MDSFDLHKRCSDLHQFISLFNAVAHGAPMDDGKVVAGAYFDTRYRPDEFAKVEEQAARLLALPEFPADAVADTCQRQFGGADECRRWLEKMLAMMAERVRRENPEYEP